MQHQTVPCIAKVTVTDWIVFEKEWNVWNNINEITSEPSPNPPVSLF